MEIVAIPAMHGSLHDSPQLFLYLSQHCQCKPCNHTLLIHKLKHVDVLLCPTYLNRSIDFFLHSIVGGEEVVLQFLHIIHNGTERGSMSGVLVLCLLMSAGSSQQHVPWLRSDDLMKCKVIECCSKLIYFNLLMSRI